MCIYLVTNKILYLMQGRFLHQNIDIFCKILRFFERAIKVKEKLRWLGFLTLLILAVICEQRKLHENKVTQYFWNQKCYEVRWSHFGKFSFR